MRQHPFLMAYLLLTPLAVRAEMPAAVDARIRTAVYDNNEIYRLQGCVGYQIEIEFEAGETFVGLGAGDIEGLSFVAQDSRLFLKPKAGRVTTNLTVLTNRRHYYFDYAAVAHCYSTGTEQADPSFIYALHFTYRPEARGTEVVVSHTIDTELKTAATRRPRNVDYWYCGNPTLKPTAASDDGVHTRLRFGQRAEQPALFVRNEDGSESVLNFSMEDGDVVVHRVARQFILRRGRVTGCIVNKAYTGVGERLESGTVAPGVERVSPGARAMNEQLSAQQGAATPEQPEQGVRGERGVTAVNRMHSMQSRVSNVLSLGLMLVLGLGLLTWYYSHAVGRQARVREAAEKVAKNQAQGEMALPALGKIELPAITQGEQPVDHPGNGAVTGIVPGREEQRTMPVTPPLPFVDANLPVYSGIGQPVTGGVPSGNSVPVGKTAGELVFERRLSGTVFARSPDSATVSGAGLGAAPVPGAVSNSGFVREDGNDQISPGTGQGGTGAGSVAARSSSEGRGELEGLLRPGVMMAARAQVLPTQRLLLPKGAFIDCTLETAIDSTLPGMTTCITATDTFSADGKVVLLERGTKLVGETRGQVQQGAARLFVLWTEARTPRGIVVPLESPGADELGRSGLPGEVIRHFWQRFGAAILVSAIDGAVQGAVQSSAGGGGGTVIYSPSGSQGVMTEVLKETLSIAPTIVKHNGDRIQVLAARDLDFRSVYELHSRY